MLIAVIILAVYFGLSIPRALEADRTAQLDAAVATYWENSRGY